MRSSITTRSTLGTLTRAGLLLAAVGAQGCNSHEPPEVHVVHPSRHDLSRSVSTTGTVKPLNEFQARASFPGMVETLHVALGDKVVPGQMLVQMKDPFASNRVATAISAVKFAELGDQNYHRGGSQEDRINITGDLTHARLAQAQAQKNLAAILGLHARGAASAAELLAARQQLDSANASLATVQQRAAERYSPGDVASADARLADAKSALEAARINFDNANIRSPIAGTVYLVEVLPYDFVPMGAELLHVANLKTVLIRAFFDEPDMGGLATGQPVTITWDAKPDRIWHGHIQQAPVAAMPMGPRSVGECTIAVDDAGGELLPNITVTVAATTQHHANALSIPRDALRSHDRASFVFRVIDGRLVQTPVTLGTLDLSLAEITSGLSESDVVATGTVDASDLADGMPVRVRP